MCKLMLISYRLLLKSRIFLKKIRFNKIIKIYQTFYINFEFSCYKLFQIKHLIEFL